MKIGIIGSGNMGRSLGSRLAHLEYDVFFGARRLEQAAEAAKCANHNAKFGSNLESALFGEVLIWTMREPDPKNVLTDLSALDNKIIIDLNNRDYSQEAKNGTWFLEAIAETLQNNLPKSKVVKAFNTIAMESFDIDPQKLLEANAQTFLAGSDIEAKRVVSEIALRLGFRSVDIGKGPAAYRAAEALGDIIRLLMIDGNLGGRAHPVIINLPEPELNIIGERRASAYR